LGTRPTGCRPPFQWFDSTLICEDRQWRNLELLRCQIKGDQRQQIDDLDRTRPQEGRRPTSFISRKGTTRERDLLHRPPTLPSIFPSLSPNLGMGSQVHRTQLPFQAPLMAYQRRSPLESPRQCPRDVANGNHLAASVDLAVEVTPKALRMWGLPPLWPWSATTTAREQPEVVACVTARFSTVSPRQKQDVSNLVTLSLRVI
jgi:hypothetical protein